MYNEIIVPSAFVVVTRLFVTSYSMFSINQTFSKP